MPHHERSSFPVERIVRVRVAQELRQEHLEDIDHVYNQLVNRNLHIQCVRNIRTEHRRPCLVYHVQTYRAATSGIFIQRHATDLRGTCYSQLVNVRVEYLVHESDAR